MVLLLELPFLANREPAFARGRYYNEVLLFEDYDELAFDFPFFEASEQNSISRPKHIESMR